MKEMSRLQAGMSFYGEMPDMYNIVLNADHRLVKEVLDDVNSKVAEQLQPIEAELKGLHARHATLEEQQRGKKAEEITQQDRDELKKCHDAIEEQNNKKKEVLAAYAKTNNVVPQLIDLALLQNGLLKGEALSRFIQRSVDLIK